MRGLRFDLVEDFNLTGFEGFDLIYFLRFLCVLKEINHLDVYKFFI